VESIRGKTIILNNQEKKRRNDLLLVPQNSESSNKKNIIKEATKKYQDELDKIHNDIKFEKLNSSIYENLYDQIKKELENKDLTDKEKVNIIKKLKDEISKINILNDLTLHPAGFTPEKTCFTALSFPAVSIPCRMIKTEYLFCANSLS
jgi:hypothetical protein